MTAVESGAPLLPGLHRSTQMERVYWGRPAGEVLAAELDLLGARRVFVMSNRSLAHSREMQALAALLGERLVGRYGAVRAHTPRDDVIEAAGIARATAPDLLLSLGGGSVVDATKGVALCLRHGLSSVEALDPFAGPRPPDIGRRPPDANDWVRIVSVPTTLSGAEFASPAGLTDGRRRMKESFVHPMLIPVAVILDPAMTLSAPLALLKATGMKAIDHAIERMTSAAANPFSDATSGLAVQMLARGLRQIDAAPTDLELRSHLQYGMFMSLAGSAAGVSVNVSHAIGHVLGGHAGIDHGHTTGLLLPAVLRWNLAETAPVQQQLCRLLDARQGEGAADAVRDLAAGLGMPTRLRDAGLREADLPAIAEKTMHEHLLKNSRRAVTRADVDHILATAW